MCKNRIMSFIIKTQCHFKDIFVKLIKTPIPEVPDTVLNTDSTLAPEVQNIFNQSLISLDDDRRRENEVMEAMGEKI
ncbi:hypothetical protein DPMN_180099 [Dreissena polymorpha]|uniref:Uncharacterized protein n=1 Tax=Dreissena polymorpha TaxID=45954 RepID=A0A9D4EFN0_DREPO|nr:hypothetical protein DPMN_180099 [Dreissena polymorpha]